MSTVCRNIQCRHCILATGLRLPTQQKILQSGLKQFFTLQISNPFFSPAWIDYTALSPCFYSFFNTSLIMLVWHQFILLQETFASTPPYLLSAPLWTCWSYSPNLLSLMMKLLLFTLHETSHTAMHVMTRRTHQRARMEESEVKGRAGKIEMWLGPWVCNLLTA